LPHKRFCSTHHNKQPTGRPAQGRPVVHPPPTAKDPPMEVLTNRRLLAAITLLAQDHELPMRATVSGMLTIKTNHRVLGGIAEHWHQQAWLTLQQHLDEVHIAAHGGDDCDGEHYHNDVKTWPMRLADAVTRAADYAYDIRVVAQGPTGPAPDPRVWSALLGALTMLVVQAWIGAADSEAMSVYMRSLIDTVGGL
jgi:hypothetical protein